MGWGSPLVPGYNWMRWSHVYLTLGSLFCLALYIPVIIATIKRKLKILLIPFLLSILFSIFSIAFAIISKNQYHKQRIEEIENQLEKKPNDSIALENMAQAYEAKGDYDKAIELFTKALDITENPSYVLHDRGMAYAKNNEYDKAISDMNKAMEMNPVEKDFIAQCYNDRGVIYFHYGQYEKSWQDVQKALEMDYSVHPDFLEALKSKGYSDKTPHK
jgi:tetratricopeptide (TPR) repeat protein